MPEFVGKLPRVGPLLHEHVLEELAAVAGPLPSLDHVEVEHALGHQLVRLPHLVQQEQLLPADLEQADHAALAGVAKAIHQDVGGLLLGTTEPRSYGRESSALGNMLELGQQIVPLKRCTGARRSVGVFEELAGVSGEPRVTASGLSRPEHRGRWPRGAMTNGLLGCC